MNTAQNRRKKKAIRALIWKDRQGVAGQDQRR
jgi:hypothetical protein